MFSIDPVMAFFIFLLFSIPQQYMAFKSNCAFDLMTHDTFIEIRLLRKDGSHFYLQKRAAFNANTLVEGCCYFQYFKSSEIV